MAQRKKLHKGDRVSWSSHGGTAHGTVQEEITKRTRAARRVVAASKDEPQYRVRTDEGRDAVHKPEALRRETG
ncbi:DUF2945 domain-containing protein [Micromonospora sonneratiae]|uniref:DUF2945 domain-containing protein n=1 Tax=Micromonospora sonneratiae TaxID=1184706 RepID=A0ABW3YDS3_9ACTN